MKVSAHLWEEAARVLREQSRFLLTTASPDGDAVGSMLALALAAARQGKSVQVYSPEPVPENLRFLPGLQHVVPDRPQETFDALLVLDTGSSRLLFGGDPQMLRRLSERIVNLDHHQDNDQFGDINVVTPSVSSTGEVVYELLSHLGWPVTQDVATCLLTAIMADTGVFRYPNVSAATLAVAADLVKRGADLGSIALQLLSAHSWAYLKLLGRMLANLKSDLDGKLVWSVLSREDFKACHAADDTADKMVEQLDMLRDVKAYALFREHGDGKIKVSLRSRDNLPVNQIARRFGGGGHVQAAGCQLSGDLAQAEKNVVEGLRSLFQ